MQGVDAMVIRYQDPTQDDDKPGEQFIVRRRAYAMIKQAFAANDIKFAFPTVQVTGGEAPVAAAHASLKAVPKPAA